MSCYNNQDTALKTCSYGSHGSQIFPSAPPMEQAPPPAYHTIFPQPQSFQVPQTGRLSPQQQTSVGAYNSASTYNQAKEQQSSLNPQEVHIHYHSHDEQEKDTKTGRNNLASPPEKNRNNRDVTVEKDQNETKSESFGDVFANTLVEFLFWFCVIAIIGLLLLTIFII